MDDPHTVELLNGLPIPIIRPSIPPKGSAQYAEYWRARAERHESVIEMIERQLNEMDLTCQALQGELLHRDVTRIISGIIVMVSVFGMGFVAGYLLFGGPAS